MSPLNAPLDRVEEPSSYDRSTGNVVWDGRGSLTESLERDYAAMRGEGWDLIWTPTSPLTTPWEEMAPYSRPDPDQFVATAFERQQRRRSAKRVLKDWIRADTVISQQGGHR